MRCWKRGAPANGFRSRFPSRRWDRRSTVRRRCTDCLAKWKRPTKLIERRPSGNVCLVLGLALLRLARGEVKAAQSEIRHVVDVVVEPGKRAEALAAQAEIAMAAQDLATARCAADELSKIATKIGAEFLLAVASYAHSAVLLAERDVQAALPSLRQALGAFRHLEAPYEAARVQVLLARVYRAQGNQESAVHELQAAREAFRKLGAATDLAQIDALVDLPTSSQAGPLTQREIEVVKLVASGITNRAIAKKLNISEKTVARHLNNIFNKLDLSSRAAATAYAYQHGLL